MISQLKRLLWCRAKSSGLRKGMAKRITPLAFLVVCRQDAMRALGEEISAMTAAI